MAYKVGDRVTLTSDVPFKMASRELMLRKGESGTVSSGPTNDLYVVRFDSCGWDVWIAVGQMVHAIDQIALLRAQVAARDAALDAVLELAKHWERHGFVECRQCGCDLGALLVSHGVHPK